MGLDVEYAHFQKKGSPLKVVAAEVCLVAEGGHVVFQSYCHPGGNSACVRMCEVSRNS